MKKLLLFLLTIICFASNIYGQGNRRYYFLFDAPVRQASVTGAASTPIFDTIAPALTVFDTVGHVGHIRNGDTLKYIIYIPDFKVPSKRPFPWLWRTAERNKYRKEQIIRRNAFNRDELNTDSVHLTERYKNLLKKGTSPQKFYLVDSAYFATRAVPDTSAATKWSFNAGTLMIPFKLRPRPFDFSKDISLSGTGSVGYTFTKTFTLYVTCGLGIASVTVDSANTDLKVKTTANLSAFTVTPGIVLAFNKLLQVSINIGWDILSTSDENNNGWIYNGKPWLGFGIGLNLFTPTNASTSSAGTYQ